MKWLCDAASEICENLVSYLSSTVSYDAKEVFEAGFFPPTLYFLWWAIYVFSVWLAATLTNSAKIAVTV